MSTVSDSIAQDTRDLSRPTLERLFVTIFIAFCITMLQFAFAMYWARHDESVVVKFFSLNQFDSEWYEHIAVNGYRLVHFPLEAQGNTMAHVGFFPGYPLAVRLLMKLTGAHVKVALIVTAQFFTMGVWTYVLLFLRRFRVPWRLQAVAVVTILAFPSAFFMVCGYSESLFMFTLLGYLYSITSDTPKSWISAALHGFVMSATRIVGVPLLILPLVREFLRTRKIPTDCSAYIVSACTGLGAGLFFLYCQGAFGEWNIYSHAQSHGWNVNPDFGALFEPSTYKIVLPATSWDGFVDPDDVSRLSVPLISLIAVAVFFGEIFAIVKNPRDTSRLDHIMLSLAVGCMFFITVSGLHTLGMRSVIRYMLPPFMLLVLTAASMFSRFQHWNTWSARIAWGLYSIAIALLFFVQAGHIDLYTHKIWVA